MKRHYLLPAIIFAALGLGLAVVASGEGPTPTPALRVERLTGPQLHLLPDNAVVEIGGRQITAGEIRARLLEEARRGEAEFRRLGPRGPAIFKLGIARSRDRHAAMVREGNLKVQTEVTRLRQIAGVTPQSVPGQAVQPIHPGAAQTPSLSTPMKGIADVRGTVNRDRSSAVARVLTCKSPTIDTVEGAVTPGGDIIVRGCGFGTPYDRGKIHLLGPFPGGYLVLKGMEWFEEWVAGTIPPTTGLPDQAAKIQVVTKDGKYTQEYPVHFIATRGEPILVPPSFVQYQCGSAGSPSSNNCNGAGDPPPADCSGATFCGSHANRNTSYGSNGQDSLTVTLKNGWVLDSMSWSKSWFKASISDPTGFEDGPPNYARVTLSFSAQRAESDSWFDVGCLCIKSWASVPGVSYKGYMYMIGPAGVPY